MERIVGQTIKEVRLMTNKELKREGWDRVNEPIPIIVLSNGVKLYPSADGEGNYGGALFGVTKNGKAFFVLPKDCGTEDRKG